MPFIADTFHLMPEEDDNRQRREAARTLAGQLFDAFDWAETSPGAEYWNDVYQNLMAIADGEELEDDEEDDIYVIAP